MTLDILWLILYFIIALVVGGLLFFGLIWGAMYTRIPTKTLNKILKICNLNSKMNVYDLGAGLGTFSFEAAYSGARIVAVEIDPIKIAAMKLMLRYNNSLAKAQMFAPPTPGLKKTSMLDVDIVRANLLKVDLHQADLVYCYLSPVLMPKVAARAKAQMKEGKRLVSVEHPIKDWVPSFVLEKEKIYVYTIGEN